MSHLEHTRQLLHTAVESPMSQGGVGASAIATGLATFFNVLPDLIGALAALAGIVVSIMVIRVQYQLNRKTELEIQILRAQERDRRARAENSPKRRSDDRQP